MPRRQILSAGERQGLFAIPESRQEIILLYTFSEYELSLIRQYSRGPSNRIGFAIQACYMKYPGVMLSAHQYPDSQILHYVCEQLKLNRDLFKGYGQQVETRRDHLLLLRTALGFKTFTVSRDYKAAVQRLHAIALQTDKGIVLANELVTDLRKQKFLLPSAAVIERICANAITNAERQIYSSLTASLSDEQKHRLDGLLSIDENTRTSVLAWLRLSPAAVNAKYLLEHIERLKTIELLQLPEDLEKRIHQNRLLKMAREGGRMTAQHLNDFEPNRRRATLVAVVLEARATIIDELVDLHDRIIGKIFIMPGICTKSNFTVPQKKSMISWYCTGRLATHYWKPGKQEKTRSLLLNRSSVGMNLHKASARPGSLHLHMTLTIFI